LLRDGAIEIASRRDDERRGGAALETPQELRLRITREIADLVHEHRPGRGRAHETVGPEESIDGGVRRE
jgi:hypothetical protein